jgi:hypothetical protein
LTTYNNPLGIFDVEMYGYYNAVAVSTCLFTVGEDFLPGDMRVVWVYQNGTSLNNLTGWTKRVDTAYSGFTNHFGWFSHVLQAGDTDFTYTFPSAQTAFLLAAFTIRNPFVGQTWNTAVFISGGGGTGASTISAPSVSTPNAGIAVAIYVAPTTGQALAFSAPTGMTEINGGPCKVDYSGGSASLNGDIFAKNTISGTSGSMTTNVTDASSGAVAAGTDDWAHTLWLSANPDIAVTISTATTETDTATVATASHLNSVSFVIGTALEIDIANQMATPLTGYRISPPLALPQSPITNSSIHWDETTLAPGSSVLVEASTDNGTTWQTCTNDEPVPRLLYGYNVATTLLTRVTLYRANLTDITPTVQNLEVRVATDSSSDELVSLGVFYITSTEITMSGGSGTGSSGSGGGGSGVTGSGGGSTGGALSIQISGVDQSRQVSRNTWQDVYYIPANTNYATAIQEIVDNRLPGLAYNFQSTPFVTPKIVLGTQLGNDPWQDAQDLATAIGFELFFDAAGICTLREIPDPATGQSVWTFTDGANPTIAQLDRTLTDQTTYNYVICYGESVDNAEPVQAVAFDNDPNSPTYYLGPYGIVSTTFQSAMITTAAQAQAAANALLLAVKGASENVALTVVPNPALEPGDVVTVEVSDAKITGTFLINDMQTPLSAGEGQIFTVYRQTS